MVLCELSKQSMNNQFVRTKEALGKHSLEGQMYVCCGLHQRIRLVFSLLIDLFLSYIFNSLTQSDSHELANQLLFATDLHGIAANMVMRQTARLSPL